jgi:hypothetical protein
MAQSPIGMWLKSASAPTPNANNLLTWTLTASNVQADYVAAYNAINDTKLTFTFH